MTRMEMLTKTYEEEKEELVKACMESRDKIIALLDKVTVFSASAEAWQKIVSEPFTFNINSICLMQVTKFDGEEDWREQFMLTFEDDKTLLVYVLIK